MSLSWEIIRGLHSKMNANQKKSLAAKPQMPLVNTDTQKTD